MQNESHSMGSAAMSYKTEALCFVHGLRQLGLEGLLVLVLGHVKQIEAGMGDRKVVGGATGRLNEHLGRTTNTSYFYVLFLYSTCIQSVGQLKALYTLPPGRHVYSDTNSTSLGSILATQQLHAKTMFSPTSIARYS